MNNTCAVKLEMEGLDEAERRVAALHAQWTEIAAMAREHKDAAALTMQVSRLDLVEGDTLVLTLQSAVSREQAAWLKAHIREVMCSTVRILILDGGATLSMLSRQVPAADD
jgi:hypothetical protein